MRTYQKEHIVKSVRVLDFRKVKAKERAEAKSLLSIKVVAPTPEQIIAIKASILNSQTLEEVARLEKALKSGQVLADLKIPNNDTGPGVDRDDRMVTDSGNENDGPENVEKEKEAEPAPSKFGNEEEDAAPMDQE